MALWHRHPGVRSGDQLTRGERAADLMRNGMGSWPFVFGFVVFLVAWAATNSLLLASHAWDVYPYILLNLFLSMLAAIQGAILLIAAKRSDQIASEMALHTYENTQQLMALIEANTALTEQVHELTQAIATRVGP